MLYPAELREHGAILTVGRGVAPPRIGLCVDHGMAPSRLNDSQKQELVERYCAGEASSALATAFACSVNTVSRTVRNLLPPEQYDALKTARAKGMVAAPAAAAEPSPQAVVAATEKDASAESPAVSSVSEPEEGSLPDQSDAAEDAVQSLALDDADDFSVDDEEDSLGEEDDPANQFHEVAILTGVTHHDSHEPVACQPIGPGVLPDSVYMLVDKVVELDPRPLADFPELGTLGSAEQDRQALCLYSSPRMAKRQCGRNQRVIRVPDTSVFTRTSRYLLARGITRLVMEGSLIALDS